MKKLPIVLIAIVGCWISAMAFIPWHTSTTIDGTTYKGTFYFDAPAYVEVDTIEWKDQSLVPSAYEVPDSIHFNGTTFKVILSPKYRIYDPRYGKDTTYYRPLRILYPESAPDSIAFLHFNNVNANEVMLNSVYFKDSMDYISVKAKRVYNYSAPILLETVATDTLTLSNNVKILKNFKGGIIENDQWVKYKQPRHVDFKDIRIIGQWALESCLIESIEFSGSKVDSVGYQVFNISHYQNKIKRLDFHDSPVFLRVNRFVDIKLDYFRCGADSFSSTAFYGSPFPVDTLILPKARRINIVDCSNNLVIKAPHVDILGPKSVYWGQCNPKKWEMGVTVIKQNAFYDINNFYSREDQYSWIDTLQFPTLKIIEPKAFYGEGIRMNCLVVTDNVESIGDSILMFGPKEVIVTNGNKKFYTEDGEWLFSKDNPEKPILHYGVAPNGDSYTPKSKYYGYNVDISHVKRVDIGPDFIPTGWGFYNTSTNTVSIYINKKGQECRDAMNLFKGNDIEFYVPEDVYLQLMAEHGYPPGYPTNFHPFDFSAINTTHSDSIKVSVVDGKLTVTGADSSESLEIYTTDGRLVYKGSQSIIPTVSSGVYIVRCAGTTSKVAL